MQQQVAVHGIDGIEAATIVRAIGLGAVFQVGLALPESTKATHNKQ
jgi:hypothetical protein